MIKTSHRSKGFTLIELLIVVAIIALLIAILLPSLNRARDKARQTKCLANIRGMSLGATTYASANQDTVVPAAMQYSGGTDLGYFALVVDKDVSKPPVSLDPGGIANTTLNTRSMFICPSTTGSDQTTASEAGTQTLDGFWQKTSVNFGATLLPATGSSGVNALLVQVSYGMNGNNGQANMPWFPCQTVTMAGTGIVSMDRITRPGTTVFMYDGMGVNPNQSTSYKIMGRHGKIMPGDPALSGVTNVAFFDGHAESVDRKNLPQTGGELSGGPGSMLVAHQNYIWRLDQ